VFKDVGISLAVEVSSYEDLELFEHFTLCGYEGYKGYRCLFSSVLLWYVYIY